MNKPPIDDSVYVDLAEPVDWEEVFTAWILRTLPLPPISWVFFGLVLWVRPPKNEGEVVQAFLFFVLLASPVALYALLIGVICGFIR